MFCGIGRKKDGHCKKPPKSPIVFGQHDNDKKPSVSPITTKTGPIKRPLVSPIQTPPEISHITFEEAVKALDVTSEQGHLADKYGLVAPGNLPGRAYDLGKKGHPAYAHDRPKTKTTHTKKKHGKGGRYKKRKTRRRRRKRRKTKKKRKRKKRRRKTRRN